MGMTRRGWFGRLVGGVAAAVLGRKSPVGGRLTDDGTHSGSLHAIERSMLTSPGRTRVLTEKMLMDCAHKIRDAR